nr:hypothetical protein [uncultured Flavobacterium sp.]
MTINKTDYYIEIETEEFTFLIQNDGSQISIEKEEGDSLYIDIDKSELEIIRNAINEVLNN